MKFLGGFLKVLAIILLILSTASCTAVAVMSEAVEGYIVMSVSWVGTLFVALNILGTGIALTRLHKLEKKVEQLEQRMTARPVYREPVSQEGTDAQPAPVVAEPVATMPAPQQEVKKAKKGGAGKWIALAAALVLVIGGVAAAFLLGGGEESAVPTEPEENFEAMLTETPGEDEPCAITVNAICVDDSYVDKDGSPLKLVYLFYTIHADSANLKIDSKYTQMRIGENTYESDNFADVAAACKYTINYYYGSYIRDVYVGDSMNVIATFYIPEGDLEPGKTVTLADSQIPGVERLVLSTDEFMHYGNSEDIAMAMDPEGYERSMYAREEADSATAQKVKSQLNGYYWSFYVNSTSYKLEFWNPNNFSVTTAFGSNSGTYSVRNGFIFCTYPDTGYTVEIPYTLEDGDLDLDTIAGFDVMG